MQNYEISDEQVKLNRERMTEKVIGEVVQCTRKGSRGNWLYSPAYEWAESQVRGVMCIFWWGLAAGLGLALLISGAGLLVWWIFLK